LSSARPPIIGTMAWVKRHLPLLAGGCESHRQLRRRLVWLLILVLVGDVGATFLVHCFDHVGWTRAIEWTTSEFTTAGSSQGPNGRFGKAFEVILGLCAVTVVAALAGSLGAFFHRRGLELAPLQPDHDER
jgi:hypothetical protein